MTVQGHAALFALLLQKPVRVRLNRPESIRSIPSAIPCSWNTPWAATRKES